MADPTFKAGDRIRLTMAWAAPPPWNCPVFAYHQLGEVIEGPDAKGLVRCIFHDTAASDGVGTFKGSRGRIFPIPTRYLEHVT